MRTFKVINNMFRRILTWSMLVLSFWVVLPIYLPQPNPHIVPHAYFLPLSSEATPDHSWTFISFVFVHCTYCYPWLNYFLLMTNGRKVVWTVMLWNEYMLMLWVMCLIMVINDTQTTLIQKNKTSSFYLSIIICSTTLFVWKYCGRWFLILNGLFGPLENSFCFVAQRVGPVMVSLAKKGTQAILPSKSYKPSTRNVFSMIFGFYGPILMVCG